MPVHSIVRNLAQMEELVCIFGMGIYSQLVNDILQRQGFLQSSPIISQVKLGPDAIGTVDPKR